MSRLSPWVLGVLVCHGCSVAGEAICDDEREECVEWCDEKHREDERALIECYAMCDVDYEKCRDALRW